MAGLEAAVDVGGTFIDIVLLQKETGETTVAKVLHRPGHQGEDVLGAIRDLSSRFGSGLESVETLVIGTTVVTNALLEHALPRTALITTEGFRDVIEIARMTRASSYDLDRRRPDPIAPRQLRLEMIERMGADGFPLVAFDAASLTRHIETLRSADVGAIAVSFLFSFANPDHERQARDILSQHFSVPISISSDVLATFREYERTSTTVVNAATTPVMARFLDSLASLMTGSGPQLYVMGSDGGCLTLPEARRLPARCTMSGPAGGVLAALRLAERYDLGDVLTLDVGGTSTDVALLRSGSVPLTSERMIGGYAVALPSVEVETVGAGGGSIAHLDRTGLLKVGPRSAGGSPGPVCYSRGGTEPTVTDAHVALGRLGTRTMLGGGFEVDDDAARKVIERNIAQPAGISMIRAAQGILEIATSNIVRAVRSISIERGHDPRKMTLIAFGGAGPLHAGDVARALEIPRVVVPLYPGVWSAIGILAADIQYSAQRTWMQEFTTAKSAALVEFFDTIGAELLARAQAQGMAPQALKIERSVDMRYKGQSHSLAIPLPGFSPDDFQVMVARFHEEHGKRYGHSALADVVEIVNVHVAARQPRQASELRARPAPASQPRPASVRKVWYTSNEPVDCPIYMRSDLGPGAELSGPAVVEQYDTTVVVSPGDRLRVAEDGATLIIAVST